MGYVLQKLAILHNYFMSILYSLGVIVFAYCVQVDLPLNFDNSSRCDPLADAGVLNLIWVNG
jgi:hypothetical protein